MSPHEGGGMPKRTLASVANLLRRSRLLTPEALRGLDDLRRQHATPGSLLRAVLKRSWVTPYQAVELFSGRGRLLFLGEYVVLGRLGGGALAQVFKARH